MVQKKINKNIDKEYIIIYKSQEHYEVLGFVRAPNMEEAKKRAHKKLLPEAKYYSVIDAEINEISQVDKMNYNLEI